MDTKIVLTEKQLIKILRAVSTSAFTPNEAAQMAARIGGPHQLEIQRALTEMRRTENG